MSSTRGGVTSTGSSWCTIESDPGVFTELIAQIGVKDVQVEELYELDKKTMEELQPIYGLIFLFKWRSEKDDRPICSNPDLFFANQVINNACATQAILSILLNVTEVELGEELNNFREFTRDFPPDVRGLAISNSELIRTAHNSFARPEPFVLSSEKVADDDSDDVYHFISYLPFQGAVYELDGLKNGPLHLGAYDEKHQNWLDVVIPVIQQRIERYARSEIRFNLMAIIKDKKMVYREQIDKLELRKQQLQGRLEGSSSDQSTFMDIDSSQSSSPEELRIQLQAVNEEIRSLQHRVDMEVEKFKTWRAENIRRKHNYIPFFVNLLKILADKGELAPLIQTAQKR